MPIYDDQLTSTKVLDQDGGISPPVEQLAHHKTSPVSFDFERVTRFMSFGFLMAPIQLKWFGFLARTLPLTLKHSTVPVLKRVALDQLMFAPVGMCFHLPNPLPQAECAELFLRPGLLFQFHELRGRWKPESVKAEVF